MWTALDEDRLKRTSQSAGWRWIGYVGLVLGLVALVVGFVGYGEAVESCQAEAGPTQICQVKMWPFLVPGGAFVGLGLLTALPAEKAAKEARELKIQKQMALEEQGPPVQQASCGACNAPLAAGQAFCGACGQPAGRHPMGASPAPR